MWWCFSLFCHKHNMGCFQHQTDYHLPLIKENFRPWAQPPEPCNSGARSYLGHCWHLLPTKSKNQVVESSLVVQWLGLLVLSLPWPRFNPGSRNQDFACKERGKKNFFLKQVIKYQIRKKSPWVGGNMMVKRSIWISSPLPTSCMALGKSLNLSDPRLPLWTSASSNKIQQ